MLSRGEKPINADVPRVRREETRGTGELVFSFAVEKPLLALASMYEWVDRRYQADIMRLQLRSRKPVIYADSTNSYLHK